MTVAPYKSSIQDLFRSFDIAASADDFDPGARRGGFVVYRYSPIETRCLLDDCFDPFLEVWRMHPGRQFGPEVTVALEKLCRVLLSSADDGSLKFDLEATISQPYRRRMDEAGNSTKTLPDILLRSLMLNLSVGQFDPTADWLPFAPPRSVVTKFERLGVAVDVACFAAPLGAPPEHIVSAINAIASKSPVLTPEYLSILQNGERLVLPVISGGFQGILYAWYGWGHIPNVGRLKDVSKRRFRELLIAQSRQIGDAWHDDRVKSSAELLSRAKTDAALLHAVLEATSPVKKAVVSKSDAKAGADSWLGREIVYDSNIQCFSGYRDVLDGIPKRGRSKDAEEIEVAFYSREEPIFVRVWPLNETTGCGLCGDSIKSRLLTLRALSDPFDRQVDFAVMSRQTVRDRLANALKELERPDAQGKSKELNALILILYKWLNTRPSNGSVTFSLVKADALNEFRDIANNEKVSISEDVDLESMSIRGIGPILKDPVFDGKACIEQGKRQRSPLVFKLPELA
ncbi:hypothetical protein [Hyphomicrobium sp. LHD-15]|uniref:hypothetical protein n=1 Tax=Hyphomicrobium sp. LHD-15 TaxID=3072142 RepID=UPI002810093C|nr:hypothetical protein [Hyphomicrobium sp. LHD-15]MDQ8699260.1 hypothetical protein [Hyphomicrobium sp. LHD-15]